MTKMGENEREENKESQLECFLLKILWGLNTSWEYFLLSCSPKCLWKVHIPQLELKKKKCGPQALKWACRTLLELLFSACFWDPPSLTVKTTLLWWKTEVCTNSHDKGGPLYRILWIQVPLPPQGSYWAVIFFVFAETHSGTIIKMAGSTQCITNEASHLPESFLYLLHFVYTHFDPTIILFCFHYIFHDKGYVDFNGEN